MAAAPKTFSATSKEDGEAKLEALKKEMGWHTTRTQTVDPGNVRYDGIVKYMATEHLHDEDEVRYMERGRLYFDARDRQDRWVRVQLGPGDHLVLAPNTYHRFIPRDPPVSPKPQPNC
ncbi:acireductone dioxygenase, putative [Ixodes scapularis]|uniref:acireductone dioxygenase (Fe(2+)-requiring) n=1 Tax=Ixodes scapularis TaxID=6945 RepID=B7P478_IXOSC|nr:acireductone dioxygenase, putative [Ixodes scapularis]|eukprot:XP_002405536.1 acireductone dioxygenase, putative [Ixodes scapularis]